MTKVEIRGAQYPLKGVFSDEFAFSIPAYQRPYAWTTEHAGELLDDLLLSVGEGSEAVEELNPYFLGSIVLVKGEGPDASVVDGQQRLLTLTILLAALRAAVPARYADDFTPFLYARSNAITGAPERYRVRPRERDAAFFQDYIQRERGTSKLQALDAEELSDSQGNMRDNALLYERLLGRLPEPQRLRLARFIVNRCLLVVVSTPDLDSAYRIFSVLNDRGLDLSHTDILKAEIIGAIAAEEQAEYTAKWEDVEVALGREEFEALFSHIRMIHRKAKARETVLKEFRDHVLGRGRDARQVIDETLAPLGAAQHVARAAAYTSTRGAEAVNAPLTWLNQVSDADWLPPAMLMVARHARAPELLARFLADLERLAAGLMILRVSVGARIIRYARLLTQIEEASATLNVLFDTGAPLQLTADERASILRALNGNLDSHNTHVRRYVLLRLDADLAGVVPTSHRATVTVEHVLPQHPAAGSEWLRWFPGQRERSRYAHCLGNMVLLSRTRNTAAANLDFAQKKRAYFASGGGEPPFALTAQVLREEVWTREVVERRQRELLERLGRIWRLE
ncbi:MAG: DUF262 domain-containing protein [Ktedonobacterales bacterium]|nr:DUF262 domain-containing protein [Ktedonobacterales bacterium]